MGPKLRYPAVVTAWCMYVCAQWQGLPRSAAPVATTANVVQVSVFDYNVASRNTLIGVFEMDLLSVYLRDNHEVPACAAPGL